MTNIAKIHYVKEGNTVVVLKTENLLSSKEIYDIYGEKVWHLYGTCKGKVYRSNKGTGIIFTKKIRSIFSNPAGPLTVQIPFLPYRMPKEEFSEAINQLRQAGKMLVMCIAKAKNADIVIPEDAKIKVIEI